MSDRNSAGRLRTTVAGLQAWVESGVAQSESGAFRAWRDLGGGPPAYEYPEITGYALTFLSGCTPLTPRVSSVGQRAGAWLADRLARGVLCARDGWDNGAVYLFDLGMIATGLVSFGRRTGTETFVARGLDLVDFLRGALESDPSAVWQGGPRSERRGWSTDGRAHLAKLLQSLLIADPAPSSVTVGLVERVKRLQRDDGAFETDPDGEILLHPHLYAAEGMWIWAAATGDPDALERARAAVEWALREQLDTGGLPRAARSEVPLEQSDATAQAVRLAAVLGVRSDRVDRAVARLVEIATQDGEGCTIVYQPGSPRHANTWSTLFAAQALASVLPETRPLAWWELV